MMDSLVYADGTWHEGDPPLIGALSQSYMHGTAVFDGARLFNDCVPDLGRHCERLLRSAAVMGLDQPVDAATVESLAREGARRFETGAELYIRPSLYAARGFLTPEPGSTRFLLSLMRMAMPAAHGRSITVSPFRRPGPDMAPTEAKASCLYPNGSRALQDAERRGFDNALMLDGDGNVAELA
ncbi:MAG: branched chain amino acid aminotransferase, partial [Rhodospirillales bacterium]|nr:branched chain amino acid aminotransferase [Rhodospirillales bacterium]